MYIFYFGHYSFDMWAHPLNHISPHASSRSLGQCVLTIFGCHIHQSWPDQLNETGQHEKFMFQPNRSNHISAEINWHALNGDLYMSTGPLLAWKLTEWSAHSVTLPQALYQILSFVSSQGTPRLTIPTFCMTFGFLVGLEYANFAVFSPPARTLFSVFVQATCLSLRHRKHNFNAVETRPQECWPKFWCIPISQSNDSNKCILNCISESEHPDNSD